jgi:hypothetical protein
MTDDEVAERFGALPALVNGNGLLVRRGRTLNETFLVGAGEIPVYITIRGGEVAEVVRGPALMRSWCFSIRAGAEVWGRFWQLVPEPGFHDILAMTRFGHATIEGDLQPLMAHLRYIKELLEAPR